MHKTQALILLITFITYGLFFLFVFYVDNDSLFNTIVY